MDPQLTGEHVGDIPARRQKSLGHAAICAKAFNPIENCWQGRAQADRDPSGTSVPRLFPGDKARYFPLVCLQRQ